MKKYTAKQESQRGSALILVLGILSLVLVMGMAFAFSARTNRQIARINADSIRTQLLGDSAVNCILAQLGTLGNNNNPYVAAASFASATIPAISEGSSTYNYTQKYCHIGADYSSEDGAYDDPASCKSAYDLFNDDNTCLPTIFESLGITRPASHSSDPLKFRTLTDYNGDTIGRYAFLVLEDTGKLDLNAIITPQDDSAGNLPFIKDGETRLAPHMESSDDDFSSGDFYYNILGGFDPTEKFTRGSSTPLRLGLNMRELDLPDAYLLNPLFGGSGSWTTTAIHPWMSYSHLQEKAVGTGTDNDYLHKYLYRYTFFSGEEPEAYYYQNGSTITESARFDWTGYEWCQDRDNFYDGDHLPSPIGSWAPNATSPSTAERKSYSRELVGYLTNNDSCRPQFWNGKASSSTRLASEVIDAPCQPGDSGFGIPWLSGKQQIAANLVDYSDDDCLPTADKDFSFADFCELNGPAYFGNERVPYLNELMLEARIEYPRTSADGITPETYAVTFSLIPQVELVNIFPAGLNYENSYTCRLRLYGEASKAPTSSGSFDALDTFKGNTDSSHVHLDFTQTVNYPSNSEVGYQLVSFTPVQLDTFNLTYDGSSENISTVQYKIDISRVALCLEDKDGNILDIALWDNNGTPVTVANQNKENLRHDDAVKIKSLYATLQSQDPRANYDPNNLAANWDWRDGTIGKCNTASDGFWTAGSANSNFWLKSRSATQDLEEETTVTFANQNASYSTAFHRDAPMESLWELGVIPTGEIGKTINLTDGSADDLLDQVKIGPAKLVRGKFNPNTRNPGTVQYLLEGIHASQPLAHSGKDLYVDNGDGTTGELKYVAPTSADHLINLNTANFPAATPSFSRGTAGRELLANLVSNEEFFPNDLQREQLLGRTVGLLGTRYESFTLAIAVQGLRELTGLSAADFSLLAPTLNNATKHHNSATGEDHICEILDSQVLLVQVLRDTWRNEFRITQKQIVR